MRDVVAACAQPLLPRSVYTRVCVCVCVQGGLTWLWLDSPYVLAARKLFQWAVASNDAGNPFPIHGTCLGFQLLHILASNVSWNACLGRASRVVFVTIQAFNHAMQKSLLENRILKVFTTCEGSVED